jgi:hypothetical protein
MEKGHGLIGFTQIQSAKSAFRFLFPVLDNLLGDKNLSPGNRLGAQIGQGQERGVRTKGDELFLRADAQDMDFVGRWLATGIRAGTKSRQHFAAVGAEASQCLALVGVEGRFLAGVDVQMSNNNEHWTDFREKDDGMMR